MAEQSAPSKKMEWKWVGYTFLMYLLLYFLPLYVGGQVLPQGASHIFVGAWLFAGIVLVGAVAGFLSEGVTLWEPAIAGAASVLMLYVVLGLMEAEASLKWMISNTLLPLLFMMAFFFLMSLIGAWIGERAQKAWRKEKTATL